jgi:hypothetical protein
VEPEQGGEEEPHARLAARLAGGGNDSRAEVEARSRARRLAGPDHQPRSGAAVHGAQQDLVGRPALDAPCRELVDLARRELPELGIGDDFDSNTFSSNRSILNSPPV